MFLGVFAELKLMKAFSVRYTEKIVDKSIEKSVSIKLFTNIK